MTRREALARLLRDIRSDLEDVQGLIELLDLQFDAALRHDGTALAGLAERILQRVQTMEARRSMRTKLVTALLGKEARVSITQLAATLPEPACQGLLQPWHALEALLRECKRLNQRNGALMAEQHALMARILHGEAHTYV